MKKQYTLDNVPHSHNRLPWNPEWLALKTADHPNSKLFSSWKETCRVLAENGVTPHEAEAILRSGWMTAAIRSYSKQKVDGQHKGYVIAMYLKEQGILRNNRIELNKLVCDTFTDVVPNENGVPCYRKKNLLSRADILVPVDTPCSCDPSTETYHSM